MRARGRPCSNMTRVLARKEAVTGKGGHVTVDVEAEVMRPRARGRGIPQKLDEAGRILGHKLAALEPPNAG